MIVPAFFYGRYSDVKAQTARLVQNAQKGKSLADSLPDNRTIDTSIVASGYLNLLTHRDLSIAQSHFHFTLLMAAIENGEGTRDCPLADRLFSELLEKEWGQLVFADPADGWFGETLITDNRERHRPYIRSVRAFARSLDREGARYIGQDGRLGTFWQANGALKNALKEEGMLPAIPSGIFTLKSFLAISADA
jgi:hypothetical protein